MAWPALLRQQVSGTETQAQSEECGEGLTFFFFPSILVNVGLNVLPVGRCPGMHRAEAGHKENVRDEVHEQAEMHREG